MNLLSIIKRRDRLMSSTIRLEFWYDDGRNATVEFNPETITNFEITFTDEISDFWDNGAPTKKNVLKLGTSKLADLNLSSILPQDKNSMELAGRFDIYKDNTMVCSGTFSKIKYQLNYDSGSLDFFESIATIINSINIMKE
jgi:hypothetical protein